MPLAGHSTKEAGLLSTSTTRFGSSSTKDKSCESEKKNQEGRDIRSELIVSSEDGHK
jgi:hypothetical protein